MICCSCIVSVVWSDPNTFGGRLVNVTAGALPLMLFERPVILDSGASTPLPFLRMDGLAAYLLNAPSTVCSTVVGTGLLLTLRMVLGLARATGAHPI